MVTSESVKTDVKKIINYGQPVRFKYYEPTIAGAGSYYDDDVSLAQSGNDLWTSGLHFPISTTGRLSSSESILMQQGKILENDLRLYVEGGIQTSGIVKIGLGSPPINEYKIIEDGVQSWELNGSPAYKKLFIRVLTNGSFIGE